MSTLGTLHQHDCIVIIRYSHAAKAVSQPCTGIILSHIAPLEIPGSTVMGKADCS